MSQENLNNEGNYRLKRNINWLTIGDSVAAGLLHGLEYNEFMGATEIFFNSIHFSSHSNWYQNWALEGMDSIDLLEFVSINPSSEYLNYYTKEKFAIIERRSRKAQDFEQRLKKIKQNTTFYSLVRKAHVININIGGNDFIHLRNRTAFTPTKTTVQIFNNLTETIKILKEVNPDVEIYVNEMYYGLQNLPIAKISASWCDLLNETLNEVVDLFDEVYIVKNAELLNLDPKTYFPGIDFHPNLEGYEMIAIELKNSFLTNSKYIKKLS